VAARNHGRWFSATTGVARGGRPAWGNA
jgi:hypothetical protein